VRNEEASDDLVGRELSSEDEKRDPRPNERDRQSDGINE
jgi:hypothetical protein